MSFTKEDSYASISPLDDGFYNPDKESRWTRAGLTVESFRRAPGVTR